MANNYNTSDAEAPSNNNLRSYRDDHPHDEVESNKDGSNRGVVLIIMAVFAFLLGGGIVAGVWWIMDSQSDSPTPNLNAVAPTPPGTPTASPVQSPTSNPNPTSRPQAPSAPSAPTPTQAPVVSGPATMEDRLRNEHDPLEATAFEWLSMVDNYSPSDYAEYEERYALAVFYFQTEGSKLWRFNSGWLTSTSPCGWYGVTCDTTGKVSAIELSDNSLVGTIPSELGVLTALTSITILNSFELTGSLPTQLSRLTDLKRITMRSNYLSGSIPSQISTLAALTTLDLEDNILSGSLPTTITTLVGLEQFSAGGNEIRGDIPAGIAKLTNLKTLELDRNQIGGTLPDLTSLRFLEKLDLKTNKLVGDVPVLPTSLQICDLDWNSWTNTENGIAKGCF